MVKKAVMSFVALLLLCAAPASAQDAPKVWTDDDLLKPLPQLHRHADPAIVAAFKARAERPTPIGGYHAPAGGGSSEPSRTLERVSVERTATPEPVLYAAQPLYPFVAVLYSDRPVLPTSLPFRCARPVVVRRR